MTKLASLFLFTTLLLSTVYSSSITVEYKKEYVGPTGAFTLGDIAKIQGEAGFENQVAMLQGLFLGHMPAPGRSQKFYTKTAENFKILPAIDRSLVEFQGMKMVVLKTQSQLLPGAKVKTILEKYVRSELKEIGDSSKVQIKSHIKDIHLPMGEYELHWSLKPNFDSRGQEQVKLEIFQDGKFFSRHRFTVMIQQWQKVLQTKVKVNKGTTITKDHIAMVWREITQDKRSMPLDYSEVIGKVTRRTLVAKRILFPHELEEPLLISTGQNIQLKVKLGNSYIQVAGVAREDGILGERIRVMNQESKKQLQGVVREPGVVEILN